MAVRDSSLLSSKRSVRFHTYVLISCLKSVLALFEIEIKAKGKSKIEQAFYHILFADWTSVFLAELNQVDDIEVKVIDFLKSELAKI